MLPVNTVTGSQAAIVRGLYGYDTEGIWWEQPHAIIYRGRRKIDGLRVLIKLLRDPGSTEWGADWLAARLSNCARISGELCGQASRLRANRFGPGAYLCGRRGSAA